MANKTSSEVAAAVHTKTQLLASARYAGKKDLINALLADNKNYTTDEVDTLIEKYLKGTVR
jgi:hypothetical protein